MVVTSKYGSLNSFWSATTSQQSAASGRQPASPRIVLLFSLFRHFKRSPTFGLTLYSQTINPTKPIISAALVTW
jgi:hypothetical protein